VSVQKTLALITHQPFQHRLILPVQMLIHPAHSTSGRQTNQFHAGALHRECLAA
jgi:hypothetical protein